MFRGCGHLYEYPCPLTIYMDIREDVRVELSVLQTVRLEEAQGTYNLTWVSLTCDIGAATEGDPPRLTGSSINHVTVLVGEGLDKCYGPPRGRGGWLTQGSRGLKSVIFKKKKRFLLCRLNLYAVVTRGKI